MAIIPTPENTAVTVIRDAPATTRVSGVSEAGAQRIMALSIDLYSDPVLAVVREYVSNGVDSTILAGTRAAVNITTPTRLNPVLVISDKGTGMSSSDLDNHFLMFADSTKTESNEGVGCLGVGAKSAWTISESFVVDTIKDGKRNMVRASRTLRHDDLLRDADTDAPNGTTISIPVDINAAEWEQVIRNVASAHPQGVVTVDDKAVASIQSRHWIGPVSIYRDGNNGKRYGDVTVVSGGTLFNMPDALRRYFEGIAGNTHGGTLRLSIGSFDFTPSRESLRDTERTRKALHVAANEYVKARDEYGKQIGSYLDRGDYDKATSFRNKILNGFASCDILRFKHEVLLSRDNFLNRSRERTRTRSSSWCRNSERISVAGLPTSVQSMLLITGSPKGVTPRSIGRFMDAKYPEHRHVIIANEDGGVDIPVYAGRTTVNEKEVGTIHLNASTEGISHVTYEEVVSSVKKIIADSKGETPDFSDRMYMVHRFVPGSSLYTTHMTLQQILDWVGKLETKPRISLQRKNTTPICQRHSEYMKVPLVVISHGAYTPKPLIAAFPDAVEVEDTLKEAKRCAVNSLSDETIVSYAINGYNVSTVYALAKKLTDRVSKESSVYPILKKMAEYVEKAETATDKIRYDYERSSAAESTQLYKDVVGMGVKLRRMYPLLHRAHTIEDIDHLASYVGNTSAAKVADSGEN